MRKIRPCFVLIDVPAVWVVAVSLFLPALSPAARADFKPAVAQVALDRAQAQPGGTIQATYTFRANGPSAVDMSVFVHVVGPDGRPIGADFYPDLPTTKWPAKGFVREGPFAINLSDAAAPGKYQLRIGLFAPSLPGRVELDNADRHQGNREYQVGEFEVVVPNVVSQTRPAIFNWLAVDETKVIRAPLTMRSFDGKTLERLTVSVEPKFLNPIQDRNAVARLTLTGRFIDGSRRKLSLSEVSVRVRTKLASGNVEVATLDGDQLVPKEGGVATVEATAIQAKSPRRVHADADLVVTPYYRDYHQTLVLKLFMGMEGKPVPRLAAQPMFQKPHDVMCTFEQALEVIRKTDNLTCGIPKIVYLVGWQKGGHDHGYPSWDEVNPRLKRDQDATALASLRWLIREAGKYNTTVSLHINMVDAYRQSPLWDEYLANDCLARDESGQLLVTGMAMQGHEMYNVVYPREWQAGLAQRRIDRLITMIPELKDGHTIHIDSFIAQREGGRPISPWHAKPENGGLTPDKYVQTQRRIFHYWRDRGFDVTGEGSGWAHPPGEHFIGLQGMSWWYSADQMRVPERLMARGRTDRNGDGDFRFGSSMHGEEIWKKDKDRMPGFLGMFCRTTLPWYYLSRIERVRLEDGALLYSRGVIARVEDGKKIIRKGDFVLRQDDDLFVPALWHDREIIAYSRAGYQNKSWLVPDDWRDLSSVDLYRITLDGCRPLRKGVPLADHKLTLSLDPEQAISIVPAGAKLLGSIDP